MLMPHCLVIIEFDQRILTTLQAVDAVFFLSMVRLKLCKSVVELWQEYGVSEAGRSPLIRGRDPQPACQCGFRGAGAWAAAERSTTLCLVEERQRRGPAGGDPAGGDFLNGERSDEDWHAESAVKHCGK